MELPIKSYILISHLLTHIHTISNHMDAHADIILKNSSVEFISECKIDFHINKKWICESSAWVLERGEKKCDLIIDGGAKCKHEIAFFDVCDSFTLWMKENMLSSSARFNRSQFRLDFLTFPKLVIRLFIKLVAFPRHITYILMGEIFLLSSILRASILELPHILSVSHFEMKYSTKMICHIAIFGE